MSETTAIDRCSICLRPLGTGLHTYISGLAFHSLCAEQPFIWAGRIANLEIINADLLEALEVARDCLYRTRGSRIELVEAAIAKAKP